MKVTISRYEGKGFRGYKTMLGDIEAPNVRDIHVDIPANEMPTGHTRHARRRARAV